MTQKIQSDTELTERNLNHSLPETNGKNERNGKSPAKKEETLNCNNIINKTLTFFTVEPYLLCYILPIAISALAVNKLNTEKACRVDLNYTEEICTKAINGDTDDNITKLAQLEALTLVTNMQSWQTPLASSVPAIVVLFVGAWSDRTGNRKTLMLIPIIGELVSSLGLLLATYFFLEWPLWVVALIEAVPTALSGGQTIALMGSFSYIADVTTLESRTLRMGIVAVIVTLGFPLGTSISGILTQNLGYYGVFGINFAIYLIGFIHTTWRIHDVNRKEQQGTIFAQLKLFFHPKNLWDTLSVILLSRGRQRIQIILVICAHIVIMGPVIGEAYILYQYTLARFDMDVVELSLFSTYSILLGTVGTAVAVTLFSKLLKMHDTVLGMIATSCKTVSSVVYGLAPTKEWYYSGPAFDFFGNSAATAIRSLGTKVVEPENVAKMCSLIGFAEAIIPMVYGPMYLQIFANTFESVPGATYFVGGAMTVPALLIFTVLYIFHKKQERDRVQNPAEKEMHAHDNDVTSL